LDFRHCEVPSFVRGGVNIDGKADVGAVADKAEESINNPQPSGRDVRRGVWGAGSEKDVLTVVTILLSVPTHIVEDGFVWVTKSVGTGEQCGDDLYGAHTSESVNGWPGAEDSGPGKTDNEPNDSRCPHSRGGCVLGLCCGDWHFVAQQLTFVGKKSKKLVGPTAGREIDYHLTGANDLANDESVFGVGFDELFARQGWRLAGVGVAESVMEQDNATRHRKWKILDNVTVELVINVGWVRRRLTRAIRAKDTGVMWVAIGASERAGVARSGFWSQLHVAKMRGSAAKCILGLMLPEPGGMMFLSNGEGLKSKGARAVAESAAGSHAKVLLVTIVTVEGNHAGIVLVGTKRAGDAAVADEELQQSVCDSQEVPEPNKENREGLGELQFRLAIEIDPIVDGETPRIGAKGAVENRSWFLPAAVDVN
jgi:hypothetical protein